MGPPPFGSGNHQLNPFLQDAYLVLQWGHRLSAVETGMCVRYWKGRFLWLQWGHRLSAVETARWHHALGDLRLASMGPPPFGSGNSTIPPQVLDGIIGFNGATAFRQWKLPSITPRPSSVSRLQWGHRLSAVETRTLVSRSYRFLQSLLQWGHRLSAVETRTLVSRSYRFLQSLLQWGHRLSAVETGVGGVMLFRVCIASMGPPPFGSGNSGTSLITWHHWYLLQWGHRLSAVETCRSWDGRGPGPIASMGPPPFGSGNMLAQLP